MGTLLDELYNDGPQIYNLEHLAQVEDLFRNRTALFYTPTDQIPAKWIGEGRLDITLPIASPTIFEWQEIAAYRGPRLWVDLLQRATGKLRWTPLVPAKVTLVRYDSSKFSDVDIYAGAKAILDSLKVKTAGRFDGRTLHYFGAILDDNNKDLAAFRLEQELVAEPSKGYSRIIIEQA
jgi:hypothetical protein